MAGRQGGDGGGNVSYLCILLQPSDGSMSNMNRQLKLNIKRALGESRQATGKRNCSERGNVGWRRGDNGDGAAADVYTGEGVATAVATELWP